MDRPHQRRPRFAAIDAVALLAGAALGVWAALVPSSEGRFFHQPHGLLLISALLGGLSAVGPVVILRARWRRQRAPRPGELLWATQGAATWLLWPPVVASRLRGDAMGDATAGVCYAYGTPLMALYLTAGLLLGGWIRPRRLRRRPMAWTDRVGLVLGLLWACTGLYSLSLLYREEFSQ